MTTKTRIMIAGALPLLTIAMSSCRDTSKFDGEPPRLEQQGEDPGQEEKPVASGYDEQYRPQIHYTPASNWVNDPNGMVYQDGVWHLYYQYNPSAADWGNLSWGHATSTDLVHWQEQPVALRPDALGLIFSGSAVIDKDNTAGFGKDALVAIYTSAGDHQQQSIAYSTDGGKTFTKYEGNPVIANNDRPDFRDPKVFWHEESKQWIMSLALGWNFGAEFWGSKDLKNWTRLSEFRTPIDRCNKAQWECPDLMRMTVDGREKWVLLISVNPGGPSGGSAIMYFVGDFDGTTFTADSLDYPLWLDYGTDNYAGVTWSNAPGGRHVLVGWMNNWNYTGQCPVSPWRSAFTLPRELKLVSHNGGYLLSSKVVAEIDAIAGEWAEASSGAAFAEAPAYQVQVTLKADRNATFSVANVSGERLEFTYNADARRILAKRNAQTGVVNFNNTFSIPAIAAPVFTEGDEVTFDIFLDASSVELLSADGLTNETVLVFPRSVYDRVNLADGMTARVRTLRSIWR